MDPINARIASELNVQINQVAAAVELLGEPTVVVDPDPRRVDVVFRARLAPGVDPATAAPGSPEIVELAWFDRESLPELQPEAAAALIRLARASRSPASRPVPGSGARDGGPFRGA